MKAHVADYETVVGDVGDLRAFALACDLKSLTAAARVMGESKATTSRRITRLESALGTALLLRSPRAIEVTDEGATYRARVAEVLELLGDANAVAQGARATPSGHLRVTTPPGFAEALAPVLAQFSAAFPRVVVSVHVGARFVDLETEHFDVALRVAAKLADSNLVAHRVGNAPLEHILVAAPSYLKTHPAPRRLEDLASHRGVRAHVTGEAPSSVVLVRQANGEQVTCALPVVMTCTDIALARDVVVEGAGVSILPRMLVQRYLEDGRLVHVLPAFLAPGINVYLMHRSGRFVPPKVRAFVEFAKKALVPAALQTARRATARR
jgi:DNA-binding transcriptional LysR family regulator